MGNAFLFPAGAPTYKADDIEGLFWVPESLGRDGDVRVPATPVELRDFYSRAPADTTWIPCQYIPARNGIGARHLIMYFHGNSCDLGDMQDEMRDLSHYTGRHVVQMEFPGYGICSSLITKPETIDIWARAVAHMIIACGVKPKSLILMGRSIGTGPAAQLALFLLRKYGSIGGLVLHSPYKSIHEIIIEYAWVAATYIIPNYWNTQERLREMETINSDTPLLIVHGEVDEVIPVKHGREMFNEYKGPRKIGAFPPSSYHNEYNVGEDLAIPIRRLIDLQHAEFPALGECQQLLPLWDFVKPTLSGSMASADDSQGDSDFVAALSDNPITKLLFCGCGSPFTARTTS